MQCLCSLFTELLCETGSFFPDGSCPAHAAHCLSAAHPAQTVAALLQFLSHPCLCGPPPCCHFSPSAALLVWLFCLTVSLILWLLECHAVWFSGTSGCLLILDWWLSSFWLCIEVKGFYLRLHLGRNSAFLHTLCRQNSIVLTDWKYRCRCEIPGVFY